VSQRRGLEIFRNVRAMLVKRGLPQPHAEVYAKDIVLQYGRHVAKGRPDEAIALVSEAHADEIAKLHGVPCHA